MAVQILPQNPNLGELFGSGLSTGLQQLMQMKLQDMQQRQGQQRQSLGLQALGFQPEVAQQLALLPESTLKEVVKQQLMAPQQAAFASALGELFGQPQPQQEMALFTQDQQQPSQSLPQGLQSLIGGQPQLASLALEGLLKPQGQLQQPLGMQQQISQESVAIPEGQRKDIIPIAQPRLNEKQATEIAKLRLQKEKMSTKERAESFKLTKDIRKDILDKAKAARQNLHDLDRMEELQKEGKLDTPGYVEFLKRSGLDIPALMNPGSEEFAKITANFMRDAKAIFGNRVSNFEMEQFLKALPSLSQSPIGRNRVIANLKYINRASLAYNEAMKDVVAKNKGIPPLDLAEQIDDQIENKLDVLARKFKDDLSKPVPKGQNKLITALQSVGGTIAGRLPKAAAGAGVGALAASKFGGPIGTLGGAALGGLAGLSGLSLKDLI